MTARTATEELELIETGRDDRGPSRPGAGWEGGRGGGPDARPASVYLTGIWLALASILMFFMALTSALIVRRGLSDDWAPFELPRILWLSTGVILASSVAVEIARRALAGNRFERFERWWMLTTLLGLGFLAAQLAAWLELSAQGVFLATNPSSSFFYLLTGTHGLHLAGGLFALAYVGARGRSEQPWPARRTAVAASAIYWHFLGALWVFLFLLLRWGR
jgi:cytochrome c oxidase subunit 3